MTDNRTNEKIVAEALSEAVLAGYRVLNYSQRASCAYLAVTALAAAGRLANEPTDARDYLHAKCDCVPDLGPAHCHFCGNVKGSPVPWTECDAVAAPDAATEELAKIKPLFENLSREYPNECNKRVKAEAERDAALAAIAAVNAIHVEREHRTLDGTYLGGTVCDGCRRPWPCPTVAALDGAPEPDNETEEEMYQARCGSWDCRAPECGRAQR